MALIASAGIVLASATSCAALKEPSKTTDQQIANAATPKVPNKSSDQLGANAAAPKEPKKMTDQQIANAVDHTFLTDAALHNKQIDITVNDQGIVTLTGGVDNLMLKERAAKLAETIRGVRGVVNTVTLKTPSRSDDQIRKDVESALLYDAATDSYKLNADVKGGVVTLSGTVPSYREKQLAVYVTKGVKGVKAVNESITLDSKSNRPDAEIAAEVKRAIAIDVWLHPNFITTAVKDGVVTLSGTVGNPAQHDRAMSLAWTSGVMSVNAKGLKIEPWAKADSQRQDAIAVKGDAQIKQAVHDAFVYDPRVNSFNPRVDVENGVVTLAGVVDNLKAKRAAEQDAKNTWGVWRVRNLLKARPANPIADDKLVQNVNSAFQRDSVVGGYDISVKARNGVIALTGTVDSYYEKSQAEDIASRANGVLDVENNLRISYPTLVYYDLGFDPYWAYLPTYSYWDAYRAPYYSTWPYLGDALVKNDIEDKLYWSPWVNLDDINVKVSNGVATLTGNADNWFEIDRATEEAFEGGAQQVYNNVTIR
jgi:osmotically-inducible protein OsmY